MASTALYYAVADLVKGKMLAIRDALKALRKALGVSQSELARKLGVTSAAVSAWEQGAREPERMNCLRMASLCDGKLSEFFALRAGVEAVDVGYYSKMARRGSKRMARAEQADLVLDRLAELSERIDVLVAALGRVEALLEARQAGAPGITVQEKPIQVREGQEIEHGRRTGSKRSGPGRAG